MSNDTSLILIALPFLTPSMMTSNRTLGHVSGKTEFSKNLINSQCEIRTIHLLWVKKTLTSGEMGQNIQMQ